jgi:hypothetical protein
MEKQDLNKGIHDNAYKKSLVKQLEENARKLQEHNQKVQEQHKKNEVQKQDMLSFVCDWQ